MRCFRKLFCTSYKDPISKEGKKSKIRQAIKHYVDILTTVKTCKSDGMDWLRRKASLNTWPFVFLRLKACSVENMTWACEASVSSRVRGERWDKSEKKKNDGRGGGVRRKRFPANPMILENRVRPDWCCAGSVDYLALETSVKPGMLCFIRASQIWSHLICGRTLQMLWTFIWIALVRRFMRSESSKYNWRLGRWRRANLTGKNGLFVGDNSNVNQNIGTGH